MQKLTEVESVVVTAAKKMRDVKPADGAALRTWTQIASKLADAFTEVGLLKNRNLFLSACGIDSRVELEAPPARKGRVKL